MYTHPLFMCKIYLPPPLDMFQYAKYAKQNMQNIHPNFLIFEKKIKKFKRKGKMRLKTGLPQQVGPF
jgi:hypothetical protein